MHIRPHSSILISGQHAEGGVPVHCPDPIARELIAQGLAVKVPLEEIARAATPVVETTALPAVAKQTAGQTPGGEHAATVPPKRKR